MSVLLSRSFCNNKSRLWKTIQNTFKKLIEAVKEAVIEPEKQTLYVSHSNAIDDAIELAERVKEELKKIQFFFKFKTFLAMNKLRLSLYTHTASGNLIKPKYRLYQLSLSVLKHFFLSPIKGM